MKAFPFSLDGAAKYWLCLQPVLFNTWGDMKRMFLEKFFPASRTTTIRKEICGIRQHSGETLHEYWERFNKLCTTFLLVQVQSKFRTPVLSPYQPWVIIWQSPKVRPLPYRGITQSLPHQLVGSEFRADFRFSNNNR
ncbi:hypothetical protein CR513_16374, partial [Mucuna pruriens]